ncbi:MAG TPA: hypothetical protein VIK32_09570, partial [Candidatus Limnocylindrales bacterium]
MPPTALVLAGPAVAGVAALILLTRNVGWAPGDLAKGQCARRCAVRVGGLTAAPADAVHDERDRCGHCYEKNGP